MILAHATIVKTSTTEGAFSVGARYSDAFGRVFRWAKAGEALSRGKLAVAPTVEAQHINLSFAVAPAIGDKSVSVTLGSTAATKDMYKGGQLVVQDGLGEGRSYRIAGNAAAALSTAVTVVLEEPIDTVSALSAANVDLLANPWRGALVSIADQADYAVGVPVTAIASGSFGFIQTGGPCAVLFDEAVTNGLDVTIGSSTVGAVEAADAAGEQVVGTVSGTAGVDTEYQNVELKIDRPFQ